MSKELNNVRLGNKYALKSSSDYKTSDWLRNLVKSTLSIAYIIPTRFHSSSDKVIYYEAYDENDKLLKTDPSNYLAIGYDNNYDLSEYKEPIKYDIESILNNLDKLENKI